jgi:hypothetical protein
MTSQGVRVAIYVCQQHTVATPSNLSCFSFFHKLNIFILTIDNYKNLTEIHTVDIIATPTTKSFTRYSNIYVYFIKIPCFHINC